MAKRVDPLSTIPETFHPEEESRRADAQEEEFVHGFLVPPKPRMLLLRKGFCGALKHSFLRSIAWRAFLGVLPPVSSATADDGGEETDVETKNLRMLEAWLAALREGRELFERLWCVHGKGPHGAVEDVEEEDLAVNNPLSTADESPWVRYFQRRELGRLVDQDLCRLHPDIEFFHSDYAREVMRRVLVVWSAENETVGYRQGMHEVLSPFVLVCARDSRRRAREITSASLVASPGGGKVPEGDVWGSWGGDESRSPPQGGRASPNVKEALKVLDEILSPGHVHPPRPVHLFSKHPSYQVVADCFLMFDALMNGFRLVDYYTSSRPALPPTPTAAAVRAFRGPGAQAFPSAAGEVALLRECERIQGPLLKQLDSDLAEHLARVGVEPQLYALRWLRLLFVRELPLEDCLTLWDALMTDMGMEHAVNNLAPYVASGMIVYLKPDLMGRDYGMCIKRLQNFAPVCDVHVFVQRAVELRYPADRLLHALIRRRSPFLESGREGERTPPPPPQPGPVSPAPPGSAGSGGGPPTRRPGEMGREGGLDRVQQWRTGKFLERVASTLEENVGVFGTEITDAEVRIAGEEACLMAVAQLKQAMNALLGRIPFEDSGIV